MAALHQGAPNHSSGHLGLVGIPLSCCGRHPADVRAGEQCGTGSTRRAADALGDLVRARAANRPGGTGPAPTPGGMYLGT